MDVQFRNALIGGFLLLLVPLIWNWAVGFSNLLIRFCGAVLGILVAFVTVVFLAGSEKRYYENLRRQENGRREKWRLR